MAKTNFQHIEDYHQAFDGETLKRLKLIRKMIHEVVPEVEEAISYQIPCFKYKGYLLYYSAYPAHISLSYPYSDSFWLHFKEALKDHKKSKSAIQFPASRPMDEKLIRKIISFRKKENEEKEKR